MNYVALLRGINVGGNNRIEMGRLRMVFENLGYTMVSTYINSGNVFFAYHNLDTFNLATQIEQVIYSEFNLDIPVVVRTRDQIAAIFSSLPKAWKNDQSTKTDVLFLWDSIDSEEIINELKPTQADTLIYVPGAILWHLEREDYNKSALPKLIGSKMYKQITVRNCNTLRKIAERMSI